MKNIIINVDDLGFSSAVNRAVVVLAEQERIHATSFMSLGSIEDAQVCALKDANIEIGLHFDLTGLAQQGSLKSVLLKSYLRQFSTEQLKSLIELQFDQFEAKIGAIPAFVDGHQHVHQFPQVRQILLDCIQQRYQQKIPIRNTSTYQTELKAKIIYYLGGSTLQHQLLEKHWPHNASFAGIYDFNADMARLQQLWQQWLQYAPDNTVIMCHPAQLDPTWKDEISAARYLEYQWLLSTDFLELWQKNQCQAQSWHHLAI
ncbi:MULTISPECIES: ChbG/HpnK family deacetylase [unclassified Acinetobacter]|uniref:ChbG/HpnK family deacetylase n=1 Tax=unclassified Acinetobacter TaxID=196816 RepID=UPI0029342F71|nr:MULTISPECIES: ChbG/HpnK family deacetylase [unclassified Acinetobacter]WOE30408.1 ChbG/HpnK family deacetylase [Acinetobacter sp. SAAs470]WOE38599.1 ChbG/HpnK family deacetylase [Acinetobacter sp. SAAs474]